MLNSLISLHRKVSKSCSRDVVYLSVIFALFKIQLTTKIFNSEGCWCRFTIDYLNFELLWQFVSTFLSCYNH